MQKTIVIRTSKETQHGYVLGEKLENSGFVVNYLLSDEVYLESDVVVLIIDKVFNFMEACSYLLTYQKNKNKLIWVISESEENERERKFLYHLGMCHFINKTTDCNEEIYSIVNTIEAINKSRELPLLDDKKRSLVFNNKENDLTPKEYKLLSNLYANINEVVLYNDITLLLWGEIYKDQYSTKIANIIHSLRIKLTTYTGMKIKTVRKKGYMLSWENQSESIKCK